MTPCADLNSVLHSVSLSTKFIVKCNLGGRLGRRDNNNIGRWGMMYRKVNGILEPHRFINKTKLINLANELSFKNNVSVDGTMELLQFFAIYGVDHANESIQTLLPTIEQIGPEAVLNQLENDYPAGGKLALVFDTLKMEEQGKLDQLYQLEELFNVKKDLTCYLVLHDFDFDGGTDPLPQFVKLLNSDLVADEYKQCIRNVLPYITKYIPQDPSLINIISHGHYYISKSKLTKEGQLEDFHKFQDFVTSHYGSIYNASRGFRDPGKYELKGKRFVALFKYLRTSDMIPEKYRKLIETILPYFKEHLFRVDVLGYI